MPQVGAISASVNFDVSNFIANAKRMTSEAFKSFSTIKTNVDGTTNTLGGLNASLQKLNVQLQNVAIGSKEFKTIQSEIQKTQSQIDSATQSTSRFGKVSEIAGQAGFNGMSLFSAGIKGAVVAMAGLTIGKSIELGLSFEKQMSEVGAAANATEKEFKSLELAARKLGATTSFSATQAAQGMTELAKAGLNVNQVLTGTEAVLNLAKAGSIGLAESATIAADTMAGFGLEAEDLGRISDVLAKAANSSTIGVMELGETFKYVSGVAKSAGISVEQVAAATSLLGNAGIKGSQAGTTLTSIILGLSAPSKAGEESLKRLGLSMSSLQDKQGNLKQLPEIFALLNDKASKFSKTQKADIFKELFGTESLAGALALMDKAEMKFNATTGKMESDYIAMVDVMNNQSKGFAKQYGDALSNNVRGQLDNLSSAIEELFLTVWDIIKPVMSIVVMFTNTIVTIGTNILRFLLRPFKDLFDFLKPSFMELLKYFDSFGNSMTDLNFLFDSFYDAIMQIPSALFATADALDSLYNDFITAIKPMTDAVLRFFDSFGESQGIWDSIKQGNAEIAAGIQKVINYFKENVTVLNVVKASFAPIVVIINLLVAAVRLFVAGWNLTLNAIDAVSRRLQPLRDLVSTIVKGIKDLLTGNISLNIDLPDFTEKLKSAFDFAAIYNYFSKGFAAIWNDITRMAKEFWESFKNIAKSSLDAIRDFFKNDKSVQKAADQIKKPVDIKATAKITKVEMAEPDKKKKDKDKKEETSNLDFGDIPSQIQSATQKIKDFDEAIKMAKTNSELLGLKIGKIAVLAKASLEIAGTQIINLMNSQAQLANAKLDNFKQKLQFVSQALDKITDDNLKNTINAINAETNAQLALFDEQLSAIEANNEAQLQAEKDFQAEMKALKQQMDEESKAEAERRFEEAWAARQQDYDNQLAFIEQNTADATERAISEQSLLNQQEQEKLDLRQTINDQLAEQLEANNQVIAEKELAFADQKSIREKEEQKKREAIELQKTAFLAEQENKRQQAQNAADQAKADNAKKAKLFEWVMGKNAFEIGKKAQIAQAQMQIGMGLLSAAQAMAFIMSTIPPPAGIVMGAGVFAMLSGMMLATGANSIATINTTQYPPPPVFAMGGIVPGNSYTGDKVPAMVNSGEMILNASQQKNLFEMANTGNGQIGGHVTNVYYAGVQIGAIQSNSPDEIYRMVEPRIRQEIYQAVTTR